MRKYTIIDADTHVTETPDLWTSRAPASMRDRVPYVVTGDNGVQRWVLGGGSPLASVGMTATAGRGSFAHPPKNYEGMHPGAYDAKERLKYMDQMGIWAMVMYPNVGGFGAQQFLKLNDPDLMLTCVQIYNDWQTEWASADLRRLLPITSIPFWDVDAAVTEIQRCAKKGHKGILFTGEPQYYGKPLLGDPFWNKLWDVAVDCDLPISFHIGSGDMQEGLAKARVQTYGKMAAFTELAVDIFLHNALQLNDLLMSGVLVRNPKIKFVSVESGIGWIPFALEAMDYQFMGNSVREEQPDYKLLPSEYFARNVYACYWFEQTAPRRLIDKIGVDNVLFETDFPHPTSLYGEEVFARIKSGLSDCEESVRNKILWENSKKLYKVDGPTAADEAKLAAMGN
ncbi:MAG TPA: amidohydrolase family protein [Candidatus Binataceae bacterium]|nr:amidohydrolase family protein [Candidatus Binataceae bacterium]